jgi:hypothetical protein
MGNSDLLALRAMLIAPCTPETKCCIVATFYKALTMR